MAIIGLTPLFPVAFIWSIVDVILLNKEGAKPAYQPKDAIWAIAILVIIVPAFLFTVFFSTLSVSKWYSNKYILPKQTVIEGNQIANTISDFNVEFGRFPNTISEIVKNNPIRASWHKDSWGQPYYYEISENGHSFTLSSKGPDKIQGTEDDINISN